MGMAPQITTDEAERLAREVAQLTGETPDQAVITSLQERLTRLRRGDRHDRDRDQLVARIMAIGAHCASLPVRDPLPFDDILGYDEHGLPQ